VTFTQDEQVVEELAADGADPAFRVGVRARRLDGVRRIVMFSAVKTTSNAVVNFASRSLIR
jgi:hypothetical protein